VNRVAVMVVATCSLVVAFAGESAYAMLEEAYALTLVGLFVPLMLGLYTRPASERPGLASMLMGTGIWGLHFLLGWESAFPPLTAALDLHLPVALTAAAGSLLAYFVCEPPWRMQWSRRPEDDDRRESSIVGGD